VRFLHQPGDAVVHARHGWHRVRHELWSLGKLRWLHRLLRRDGNAVQDGDGFDVWSGDVQCIEHQRGDAGVYADGSRSYVLPGDELRELEQLR
jgi:hypothetical protein